MLKWAGMAVCVLLLALFVGCVWYGVVWRSSKRPRWWFAIVYGQVALGAAFSDPSALVFPEPPPDPYCWKELGYPPGWRVYRDARSMRQRLRFWAWLPAVERYPSGRRASFLVWVPIWMPLVLVALPTAFLWRLDRRRIPPGHCLKCGYNLTGNVSGVCPECGTPTTQSIA